MATTDTEKVVTLNIKTDGAIKSMKDLKQAIKDGKDQLVQLDQTSEEYEQTLSKVAELQHQYREINEQVNQSTMDFGQTISNVNSVMAGGVAAIQGVTAGLSLMGVDLGDDDKLTKNLVKSMSLLQAMSQMDAAVKGFKALTVGIKGSITAAGGLGKALKALAISNPFTAILAGAAALLAIGVKIVSMFRDAREAAEALKDAAIFDVNAQAMKEMGWQLEEMTRRMKLEGKNQYEIMEAEQKQLLKNIQDLENKSVQLYKRLEDASGDRADQIQAEIDKLDQLKQKYIEQREYNTRMRDILWEEEQKRQQEEAEKEANAAKQAANARAQAAQAARQKLEQQQANAYKHELSLLKQTNAELLHEEEMRYHDEQVLYENNAVKLEEAELEHQKRTTEINNKYLQEQITLAQQRLEILNKQNKDNSKQGDIDVINEQIAEMTRQIELNTQAYNDNERAVEKARIQRELELKQLQKRLEMDRKVHDQQMETTLVMQQFDEDEIEGIKEKLSWLDYLGISYSDKYEMMMEKQRELIQLEQEEKEAKVNVEAIQQEIDLWHEKYDNIEELTAEHYEELQRLQQEYEEASAALGEVRLKRIKKELDDERQERLAYANAVGQIMGTIGSLLTSIADAEGVSFEESKKIKIAAATIDTIQGGINAYMSYIASAIPPPTDSILGGIAAAATVAMGMIEIAKIRATKPGNSPSLSGTAMQGITLANPQIVNLNAVNDEIELPDQRVWVAESDITEAQNRVHVVENNSNF